MANSAARGQNRHHVLLRSHSPALLTLLAQAADQAADKDTRPENAAVRAVTFTIEAVVGRALAHEREACRLWCEARRNLLFQLALERTEQIYGRLSPVDSLVDEALGHVNSLVGTTEAVLWSIGQRRFVLHRGDSREKITALLSAPARRHRIHEEPDDGRVQKRVEELSAATNLPRVEERSARQCQVAHVDVAWDPKTTEVNQRLDGITARIKQLTEHLTGERQRAAGLDMPSLRKSLGLDHALLTENVPARLTDGAHGHAELDGTSQWSDARREFLYLAGAEGLIPHPDVPRVWLRVPRCVALAECRACGAERGTACKGSGTHPSRDPRREVRIPKTRSNPFRFASEAFVPHPNEPSFWVRVDWTVLESACGYCKVDKGRPCVSRSGAVVSWTHAARRSPRLSRR